MQPRVKATGSIPDTGKKNVKEPCIMIKMLSTCKALPHTGTHLVLAATLWERKCHLHLLGKSEAKRTEATSKESYYWEENQAHSLFKFGHFIHAWPRGISYLDVFAVLLKVFHFSPFLGYLGCCGQFNSESHTLTYHIIHAAYMCACTHMSVSMYTCVHM